MNPTRLTTIKILAAMCMAVVILPSLAAAQAGGRRGGGGGAAGAMGGGQQIQAVLGQLDLTEDQKTKIDGILKDAQKSTRESLQGLGDATPEERQSKMQEIQKGMTDAREKIEAELTPEQKTKYFPLMAKSGLKRAVDLLAAVKTAAGKMDVKDDDRKQLTTIFDDSEKTLDGDKADADAVIDSASATDFNQKLTKFQMDLRKQIMDILGQEDTQKLMQDARQSMRPGAAGARGGAGGAGRKAAATTEPAAR